MADQFKPSQEAKVIPCFEDVSGKDGWEGHRTQKTIDKLLSEIATNLSLTGCLFTGYQTGMYGDRQGFQIHFAMKADGGAMMPSRLDICCLPTRSNANSIVDGTRKMALYMTAQAIKGSYFLTVLSPSYIPFMSLMLTSDDMTLGQAWMSQGRLSALMPPPDAGFEVVEGEVK